MAKIGDNNPPVILELTEAQAQFLSDETDNAIGIGLNLLGANLSRENAEKVVNSMEGWKAIRDKLRAARS